MNRPIFALVMPLCLVAGCDILDPGAEFGEDLTASTGDDCVGGFITPQNPTAAITELTLDGTGIDAALPAAGSLFDVPTVCIKDQGGDLDLIFLNNIGDEAGTLDLQYDGEPGTFPVADNRDVLIDLTLIHDGAVGAEVWREFDWTDGTLTFSETVETRSWSIEGLQGPGSAGSDLILSLTVSSDVP